MALLSHPMPGNGPESTKREVATIDLSPTWQGVLGLLLTTYENGSPEGRRLALVELQQMAKLADSVKGAD